MTSMQSCREPCRDGSSNFIQYITAIESILTHEKYMGTVIVRDSVTPYQPIQAKVKI